MSDNGVDVTVTRGDLAPGSYTTLRLRRHTMAGRRRRRMVSYASRDAGAAGRAARRERLLGWLALVAQLLAGGFVLGAAILRWFA